MEFRVLKVSGWLQYPPRGAAVSIPQFPKLFPKKSETYPGRVSSNPIGQDGVSRSPLWLPILLWAVLLPPSASAAGWPKWPKKKPDLVTASCSLDRNELAQGSAAPLTAKIAATESAGHQLSYV